MLMKCNECGNDVSNKAYSCPHCGFPFKENKVIHRKPKVKKLPNGFGQISKLKGRNLRKPYRALITVGKDEKGKPIIQSLKPVSYFATYNEAYEALLNNARNPYNALKELTFYELYEKWFQEKKETIAHSRQVTYSVTIKHLDLISQMKVTDIKPLNIKEALNTIESTATKKNAKILLNQVFDYAVENEIVDKNYARITKIYADLNKVNHPHRSLTGEELNIFINNKDNKLAQIILIQCYTGMRPSELLDIKLSNVNLNEHYIIGGKKTKAGINRVIPIHDFIYELIKTHYQYAKDNDIEYLILNAHDQHMTYRNYLILFKQFCELHNIIDLRPHDCRKYFVTQAKKYNLDEYAIKRIVGHQIRDITESVYTERSILWLQEEMNKIPSL